MKSYKERAEEILKVAGITVNGPASYDMQVSDERIYQRIFAEGTLGLRGAQLVGLREHRLHLGFDRRVFLFAQGEPRHHAD